jgi:hypothetical protein
MKKLFILSLCFMFFVQNVEAGLDLVCGNCCEHKRECLAEKSAVEKKYKNETEQHSNCQVDRDSYKTWCGFLGVSVVIAVAVVICQCLQIYKLKRKIERLHGHPDPYRTVNG